MHLATLLSTPQIVVWGQFPISQRPTRELLGAPSKIAGAPNNFLEFQKYPLTSTEEPSSAVNVTTVEEPSSVPSHGRSSSVRTHRRRFFHSCNINYRRRFFRRNVKGYFWNSKKLLGASAILLGAPSNSLVGLCEIGNCP